MVLNIKISSFLVKHQHHELLSLNEKQKLSDIIANLHNRKKGN